MPPVKSKLKFGHVYDYKKNKPPKLTPILVFYEGFETWVVGCLGETLNTGVPNHVKPVFWSLMPPTSVLELREMADSAIVRRR